MANTIKEIVDGEFNKFNSELQRLQEPFEGIKRKNVLFNRCKMNIYKHLKYKRRIMDEVNFAVQFTNIKDNIPRQIRLFNALKSAIKSNIDTIHKLYAVQEGLSHRIKPLHAFSEAVRKNTFDLSEDVDLLLDILEKEKKIINLITDSRSLIKAYETYYENKRPLPPTTSSDTRGGIFGGFRLKRQISDAEEIEYAGKFIALFEEEIRIYNLMESRGVQIMNAVKIFNEASKNPIDISSSELDFEKLGKLAEVSLGIPAYIALIGSIIGFGTAGTSVVVVGSGKLFMDSAIDSIQRSKTYAADYPDHQVIRVIRSIVSNLDSEIEKILEHAKNTIKEGSNIEELKKAA